MNSKIKITFKDGTWKELSVSYTEWSQLFRSGEWDGKSIESVEVLNSEKHNVSKITFS